MGSECFGWASSPCFTPAHGHVQLGAIVRLIQGPGRSALVQRIAAPVGGAVAVITRDDQRVNDPGASAHVSLEIQGHVDFARSYSSGHGGAIAVVQSQYRKNQNNPVATSIRVAEGAYLRILNSVADMGGGGIAVMSYGSPAPHRDAVFSLATLEEEESVDVTLPRSGALCSTDTVTHNRPRAVLVISDTARYSCHQCHALAGELLANDLRVVQAVTSATY